MVVAPDRHLGGTEGSGMDAMDVDWGRLEFEVSQMDFVLHSPIWRRSFQPVEARGGKKAQLIARDPGGEGGARGGVGGRRGSLEGRDEVEEERQGPLAWIQDFVQSRLQGELKD